MLPRLFAAVTAFMLVSASPTVASAGILEILFGSPSVSARVGHDDPLVMTVRPKKRMKPNQSALVEEVKPQLVVSIDPVANPNWYLTDPTLRKGDIVVLPKGVTVFNGERGQRRLSDFEDLRRTRLLSERERDRVRAFTQRFTGSIGHLRRVSEPTVSAAVQEERATRSVSVIFNPSQ